jgi:hypothetical protein
MLEEASDELDGIERQRLLLIAVRRIAPAKRNFAILNRDEATARAM